MYGDFQNEAYVSRVATNTKEACELIDVGYEYVTGDYYDGGKIFRKRRCLVELEVHEKLENVEVQFVKNILPSGEIQASSAK